MRDGRRSSCCRPAPGLDHSLYKEHVGPELAARRAGDLPRPARVRAERLELAEEHWTLDTWVDDLVGFCDALELQRPVLLGTASAALVALLYAARQPERVERLVLVSTVAPLRHTRSIAEFDRLGGPEAGEVAARYFADPPRRTFAEYMRVCVPALHARRAIPPDVVARIAMNTALSRRLGPERRARLRPARRGGERPLPDAGARRRGRPVRGDRGRRGARRGAAAGARPLRALRRRRARRLPRPARDEVDGCGRSCASSSASRGRAASEVRPHLGPLVVDDAVPGRVAALAAADEHVLAVDALELRRQGRHARRASARSGRRS